MSGLNCPKTGGRHGRPCNHRKAQNRMSRKPDLKLLFNSQSGFCSYCGCKMTLDRGLANSATRDHILPKSFGGTWAWNNMTCACRDCNSSRGNKPVILFLLQIARQGLPSKHHYHDRLKCGRIEYRDETETTKNEKTNRPPKKARSHDLHRV